MSKGDFDGLVHDCKTSPRFNGNPRPTHIARLGLVHLHYTHPPLHAEIQPGYVSAILLSRSELPPIGYHSFALRLNKQDTCFDPEDWWSVWFVGGHHSLV